MRVPGDLCVHVSVAIDEAGRDDHAFGIESAFGRRANATDLDDQPILDANIGLISRYAGTVDNRAVFDQ